MNGTRRFAALAMLCGTWFGLAAAQTPSDHLRCFKVKHPHQHTVYNADVDGLVVQTGCG